ncbi:YD repeat protein [Vibrio phage Va2]|nr:YD repeat protein [Vibrio phage Va2]
MEDFRVLLFKVIIMKEVARIEKGGNFKTTGRLLETAAKMSSANIVHDVDLSSPLCCDTSADTSWFKIVPSNMAGKANNLLDALGLDWRSPSAWGTSSADVTYNEGLDCLEVVGAKSLYFNGCFSVLRDVGFHIECEIQQIAGPGRVYVGGRYYDKAGNEVPAGSATHNPGTYDYLGVAGASLNPSTNWIKYHNHLSGGAPRKGVLAAGSGEYWRTDAVEYYRPLFLANYGKDNNSTVRIRNLRMWYEDNGTPIYHNGQITSLMKGGKTMIQTAGITPGDNNDSEIKTGWNGFQAEKRPYLMPSGHWGSYFKFTKDTSTESSGGVTFNTVVPSVLVEPNTTYTVSGIIKTDDIDRDLSNNFFYVREYDSTGTSIKTGGRWDRINEKIHLGDGWYLVWATFHTEPTTVKILCQSYQYIENTELWTGEFTFCKGNKVAYADELQTKDCGLIFKVKEMDTFCIFGDAIIGDDARGSAYEVSAEDGTRMLSLQDSSGYWCHFEFDTDGTSTGGRLVPDASSKWNTSATQSIFKAPLYFDRGMRVFYVLQKTANGDLELKFYNDRVQSITQVFRLSASNMNNPVISNFVLGKGTNWDCFHSFFTMYSSILTEEEIFELIKKRLVVSESSVRDTISEFRKDEDLFYVDMTPYHKHMRGEGFLTTTGETNLLEEDEPIYSFDARGGGGTYGLNRVMTPYGWGVMITGEDSQQATLSTSGHYAYKEVDLNLSANSPFRMSCWVYVSPDWDGGDKVLKYEGATGIRWEKFDPTLKGEWQRVTLHYSSSSPTVGYVRALFYNELCKTTKGHIIMSDFRLTYTWNNSLHSKGRVTDQDHKMYFRLYEDYGIDMTKDWTFCYWKMPIASHANTFGGYNVDSIGLSGGTTKVEPFEETTYFYWGKNNAESVFAGTSVPIGSKYYMFWRFVVITYKVGEGLKVYEIGEDSEYERLLTATIPTRPDHAYSSQLDSDLQLGGWGSSNRCTALYRDIKVGQHHLTYEKAKDIYREGLRLSKETVSLSGSFIEGSLD